MKHKHNQSCISITNADKSFFGKEDLNETHVSINLTKNSSVENDFKKYCPYYLIF